MIMLGVDLTSKTDINNAIIGVLMDYCKQSDSYFEIENCVSIINMLEMENKEFNNNYSKRKDIINDLLKLESIRYILENRDDSFKEYVFDISDKYDLDMVDDEYPSDNWSLELYEKIKDYLIEKVLS